jgi:hypothetical protein
MHESLDFIGEIEEFYTYRSARCNHSFSIELSTSQKEFLREYLEDKMDNHITWKSGDMYYTYSDGCLYIGNSINIKNW